MMGKKLLGRFKEVGFPQPSNENIYQVLNRFVDGYITQKQTTLSGYCIHQEIKHLVTALNNEKEIHIKNNESLDKITSTLGDILKREDISPEERKEVYRIFAQTSNIHRESQLQKTRHVTSRVITAMGVAASVAISIGTILIHEKYKTQREREKWNNYFDRR
jgi:hypothetical protein